MPKVVIKKQSDVAPADAFNKVKNMLNDDQDLKKLDPSYKCTFNESALTGTATGKMFKADMTVKSSGKGCEIQIIVDLPFALTLAKGMVEKTLQKKLERTLS